MNIVENDKIKTIKQELIDDIKQEISFFENRLLEQEKKVVYWKYANDEFYTLIPFYHELDKLKTGRILKNIQFEKRFDKMNIFSFGFSEKDELILAQKSNGNNWGINSTVYDYGNDGSIEYFIIRTYPFNDFKCKLISRGRLTPIQGSLQIDVSVSNDNINWMATVYHFDKEKKVDKVFRYAQGWNGQTEYDFEYLDNKLDNIKVGGVGWWKSKK